MNAICPVCKNAADPAYQLDRKKIHSSLNAFFGVRFPASIIKADYTIRKCTACTLEFADPLLPGDNEFYEALSARPDYYPSFRQEYRIVAELVKKTKSLSAGILDIGCGSGDFLDFLRQEKFTDLCGIDATDSSVKTCVSKGLRAYRTRIEDFDKGPFDVIVSFHCLEHVDNPIEFIESALAKLSPGGTFYVSTPYSPQTHEFAWFHPLNHPPHHLLRLNVKSYTALAEKTGSTIEFVNFNDVSFSSLVRSAFSYALYGHNIPGSSMKIALKMLFRPLLSARIVFHLLKREKINGKIAGNEILVLFKKKNLSGKNSAAD